MMINVTPPKPPSLLTALRFAIPLGVLAYFVPHVLVALIVMIASVLLTDRGIGTVRYSEAFAARLHHLRQFFLDIQHLSNKK